MSSSITCFHVREYWLSLQLTDVGEIRLCPSQPEQAKVGVLLLTYVSGRIPQALIDGDETDYCHEEAEGYVGGCVW